MHGQHPWAARYADAALATGNEHPLVLHNAALAHFYSEEFTGAIPLLARLTAEEGCWPTRVRCTRTNRPGTPSPWQEGRLRPTPLMLKYRCLPGPAQR